MSIRILKAVLLITCVYWSKSTTPRALLQTPAPSFPPPRELTSKHTVTVCITGAAGPVAYALIPMICNGLMLGSNQHVELHLFDIQPNMTKLNGLLMEIQDVNYPLVTRVLATHKPEDAFEDADFVILLGSVPRRPGETKEVSLQNNKSYFEDMGKAINDYALKTVRAVVVSKFANTYARLAADVATGVPEGNITGLTRHVQERAIAQIMEKAGGVRMDVQRLPIWGTPFKSFIPDVSHATWSEKKIDNVFTSAEQKKWLNEEFFKTVQNRDAVIHKARNVSSTFSVAQAVVSHMRDWMSGTSGEWVSMVVRSGGDYGVPKGLMFSYPCACGNGLCQIVQGLVLDKSSQQKIANIVKDLESEMKSAKGE